MKKESELHLLWACRVAWDYIANPGLRQAKEEDILEYLEQAISKAEGREK